MGEKGTLSRMGRMARQLEKLPGKLDLDRFAILSDFQPIITSRATAEFFPTIEATRRVSAVRLLGITWGADL